MLWSVVSSCVSLSATKMISLQLAAADATVCHPAVPVTVTGNIHDAVPHAVAVYFPWLSSTPNLASYQSMVEKTP